eukprot:969925-Pyramimonas_sp.AAC.1
MGSWGSWGTPRPVSKSAPGSASHCVAHGGGPRCLHAGCTKSAEGSTPFCVAHGGGQRCDHTG